MIYNICMQINYAPVILLAEFWFLLHIFYFWGGAFCNSIRPKKLCERKDPQGSKQWGRSADPSQPPSFDPILNPAYQKTGSQIMKVTKISLHKPKKK